MPPRTTALPDAVTSALRPVQLPRQPHVRLVVTRILRPLPPHTARRAAVPAPPVPLRFTAARLAVHPPPRRCSAPRPTASCSCLTSCLRPPRIPQRRCKKAHRERLTCRPHRRLARPPPGATASSVVLVTPGASSAPYQSLRAAWSFLRDHLTPRPAVAKSTYRFCVRKIRCSPALQNIGNHRGGGAATPPILGCRAKSAGQAWFGPSSVSGGSSWPQSAIRINPSHPPPLAAAVQGIAK
jgi:hypothetical protein